MKKQLLSLGISLFLFSTFNASAQTCTPNPEYANESFGSWPDTITNLPCAFGNLATYDAVIDLKTLTDTLITVPVMGQIRAYISAFRIFEVSGAPADFSYVPNNEIWENTGEVPNLVAVQGCVSIHATQTAIQAALNGLQAVDYPITVKVDAKIHSTDPDVSMFFDVNGKWLSELPAELGAEPFPITGYKIKVRSDDSNGCYDITTTSISDLNKLQFNVESNNPNPFYDNTQIVVTSLKAQKAQFQVYNTLGAVVHNQQVQLNTGKNNIDFSAQALESGVYYYSIITNAGKVTKSMLIAK